MSEPVICLLLAISFRGYRVSFALGTYFLVGAFTLWIEALIVRQVEEAQLRSMRDARLESEYYAQRSREQGEWR